MRVKNASILLSPIVIMTLRETNRFVHSDFQLGVAKKQDAILGGKKIRFFSCYQLCPFLSLYCMSFWRDKLLNSALEYAPSLFWGGEGEDLIWRRKKSVFLAGDYFVFSLARLVADTFPINVDYEGRLFRAEVFMRLVVWELKIIFCCMLFFPVFITIAFWPLM